MTEGAITPQWPNLLFAGLSVFTTLMVAIATISFYRWVRAQREPTPLFLGGRIFLDRDDNGSAHYVIELELGNTGETPIFLKEIEAFIDGGYGLKEVSSGGELLVANMPFGIPDKKKMIPAKEVSFVRFSFEPQFSAIHMVQDITIRYKSGPKRRALTLRQVKFKYLTGEREGGPIVEMEGLNW